MLCRLATVCLPILGILLCPFACQGTGLVGGRVLTPSGCGCCGHTASGCGDSLPQGEDPPAPSNPDGCQHECVNNALVESSRALVPTSDATFPVAGDRPFETVCAPAPAFGSTRANRGAAHPASGIAVRLAHASLLL